MDSGMIWIIGGLIAAYVFEFINGFHDAANSIATIVTTKVLTPHQAVIWAAFFNCIAFMFFNMTVAHTIASDMISVKSISPQLILAGLSAAIIWGLITWYYGLPSSSSQALIGGLLGAAVYKNGMASLQWIGVLKIIIGIVLAPLIGLVLSILVMSFLSKTLYKGKTPRQHKIFALLQLLSSACLSITHGANDAQKTMGVITLLLFSASWLNNPTSVPTWVILSCHLTIALGTLTGGWRIVKTMGTGITKLDPVRGCAAESGAAIAILAATEFSIPVSTTQTVAGAIMGVGLINASSKLNLLTIRAIFISWLITLPITAVLAGLLIWITN